MTDSFLIDVKDKRFGATGNGKKDDTQAIMGVINHLRGIGGGTVYFPKGTYVISETLPLYPAISYKGLERSCVTLKMTKDLPLFTNNTNTVVKSISFKDMSFESVSQNNFMFVLQRINNCWFERLQFINVDKGILLDGANQCYYNTFNEVKFSYCNTGFELINKANRNNFSFCNFIDYTTGVLLRDGDGNVFNQCGFETFTPSNNQKTGIQLLKGGRRNTFVGIVIEQKDGYPIYSSDSDSNLVITSYLYTNGLTPAFRGIDGTGTNNTVINPLGGSVFTSVDTLKSRDGNYGSMQIHGLSKTPDDRAIRFRTYKEDNETLQDVLILYGSIDNPRVYIPNNASLYSAGQINFEQDIRSVTTGKGLVMKSPNGSFFRFTVDDNGNGKMTKLD